MDADSGKEIRFDEFRLDLRRRSLYKGDEKLAISAKLFDLLEALVSNEGRLMTHDELLDTVWSGTFVEQSSLKKGISTLRQILGETSDEGRFIKTIPRRGYSFVANVQVVDPPAKINKTGADTQKFHHSETEIVIQRTVEVEQSTSNQRRWPVALAIGSFAVCIVLLGVAVLAFRERSVPMYEYAAGKSRVDRLTNDSNCSGTVSPDGNFVLCMIRNGELGSSLELRSTDGTTKRRIIDYPDAVFYAARFSHDGRNIYYVVDERSDQADGSLMRISVLGGEAKVIERNVGSVSVSKTGKLAVFRVIDPGESVVLIEDSNGEFKRVAARFPANFRLWNFRFTPDEKGMLCAVRKQISSEKNVFYVTEVSLEDGSEKVIVPERDTLIASAEWLPDRSALILAIREPNADIRQLWSYVPSTGKMERITNDNESYSPVDLIDGGKAISATVASDRTRLWTAQFTPTDKPPFQFRPIDVSGQAVGDLFWLPDGRIGYKQIENTAEVIRLIDPTTGNGTRVTAGTDGFWLQPTLSGDRRGIVFNSARSGLTQLWRVAFDGTSPIKLTESATPVFDGMQLADGTVLYSTFDAKGGWYLARRSPDGVESVVLNGSREANVISTDGSLMAYFRLNETSKQREIVVISLPEMTVLKQFPIEKGGVRQIAFDRTSSSLFYSLVLNNSSELFRQSLAGGTPTKISNFGSEMVQSFALSTSDTQIVASRGTTSYDVALIRSGSQPK
ncbi:MAG: winged helix-turn-helix domain-containing protein [Blastocatellia bacterium]|nr:winged helix-turn-helix domain-containing protein [Blastocatellia bacterium]